MGWRLAGKRVWLPFHVASQVVLVVKNPTANAGDIRDMGSIPGLGRCPGAGHGNPLQYSCLVIPWTEEPGGLQSMGSQRVGHDWVTQHTRLSTERVHRQMQSQVGAGGVKDSAFMQLQVRTWVVGKGGKTCYTIQRKQRLQGPDRFAWRPENLLSFKSQRAAEWLLAEKWCCEICTLVKCDRWLCREKGWRAGRKAGGSVDGSTQAMGMERQGRAQLITQVKSWGLSTNWMSGKCIFRKIFMS